MSLWTWIVVVLVVAAIFMLISGEVVVTLILTALWVGAIWGLVEYGAVMTGSIGPAIVVVVGMVVLTVATLAALASAMEERQDRRSKRG
ncbi:MAG TPA: hypothetical protein VIL34_16315 [Actinopolymorphaceae bacterium]|jgi:membrane protein implicated in regulation of membrane protease activity